MTKFSRLGRAWHELWALTGDGAVDRILHLYSIMFQSASGCTIELNFGLFVSRHGSDHVQFRDGEIPLRCHCLES